MPAIVKYFAVFLVIILLIDNGFCGKKKKSKGMILRQKETNALAFIRLTAMRLIWGIATRLGLGQQISTALNGVFVPPGAQDYYDYDDNDDFFGGSDEYDY